MEITNETPCLKVSCHAEARFQLSNVTPTLQVNAYAMFLLPVAEN